MQARDARVGTGREADVRAHVEGAERIGEVAEIFLETGHLLLEARESQGEKGIFVVDIFEISADDPAFEIFGALKHEGQGLAQGRGSVGAFERTEERVGAAECLSK